MNILDKIKSLYPDFTKKQKTIADYFLANPEDICYSTLAQLSQEINVSELTLLRFCQRVDCTNFLTLKKLFREYTQEMIKQHSTATYFIPNEDSHNFSNKDSLLADIYQHDITNLSSFFNTFEPQSITTASEMIQNSTCIYIFAHDISCILGDFLKTRLHLLGFNSSLIDLSNLSKTQNCLQQMKSTDLAIIFSFPQYYYPIGNIANKISHMDIPILTITDSAASPASKYSSLLLLCPSSTKLFYNSLALPMTILNLIASCLVVDMIPEDEIAAFKKTLLS